jgi:PAS domain S-box-containing protein
MKINTMITLAFIVVIMSGVFLLTYNNYLRIDDSLKHQVFSHLETAAQSRAHNIDTLLTGYKNSIIVASAGIGETGFFSLQKGSPEYIQLSQRIRTRLEKSLGGGFNDVFLLDVNGVVVVSTDETHEGVDKSNDEYFIHGKHGVYIKDAYYSETSHEPSMALSIPMNDKSGNFVGVMVMRTNMNELNDIVGDKTGLGETGEVYLINKDGYAITPLRYGEDSFLKFNVDTENSKNCLSMLEHTTEDGHTVHEIHDDGSVVHLDHDATVLFLDYMDISVVGSHHPLHVMNWCLLAEIDEVEALGVQKGELIKSSLIFAGLLIVLVSIVGYFVGRKISNPISELTRRVNEVTRGKLDVRLGKSGISEVRDLTNSLDRVLASMKLAILRSGITKEDIGIGTKEELLKAKHAAEDRYKILFDTSRDAIMTLAPPTWGFTSGNLAAFELFGVKDLKEFTALGPGDVSPKYQPNGKLSGVMAKNNIQNAMKNGSVSFDWVHKTVDGKEFFASVLLTRVNIGDSVFLQATVRDVTDSKNDEQELKVFLKGFESSGNSMVMVDYKDMKPHIMKVNKSFTKFYGYTEKEALGKNPKVLKSGRFNKDMYKKLWKDILNPKIGFWTGEITNKNKSGKFIDVMLSISTIFDDNGKPLYFIANHTDVGNANEMRNAHKNLFDDANVMIQQCDRFGKVIDVNKKWLKTLGYSEKSIGKLNLMKIIHSSHRKECMKAFKKVMGGGSVSGIKTVFVAKNGNQIPVIVNASPIREGGKVVSTLGIVEIDYDRKIKKPVKRNIKRVKKKTVKRKVNRSKKRKRRK